MITKTEIILTSIIIALLIALTVTFSYLHVQSILSKPAIKIYIEPQEQVEPEVPEVWKL